ncbi:DUF1203 domain-containing protein [Halovulum dunhuangense]|uniref:DUF1203 domain-containing protein n=1 Tax=Halovulum dunhuangense TaxID=1505036 RepID=A0A849L495_9RHOB|nr:DUF1203 domain-containing protein [Halovulum dunhuangense]NNU81030.1 DUF1203 domain-containing protein [Halovulum dunhuangense]
MTFRIRSLDAGPFAGIFSMSDDALRRRNIHRLTVASKPGAPCRISLVDAEVGETVFLLNHEHQPAPTPYRASHAIYVRKGASSASLGEGEIPRMLLIRLISLRLFDAGDMMIDADVVDGRDLAQALDLAFRNPDVAYAHLHFATRGCFAARADRA